MKSMYILAACAILASCVTTTDPIAIGKDTYTVSAEGPAMAPQADMQQAALKKASDFCNKMGKHLMVDSTNGGWRSSNLYFMCVNDQDYKPVHLREEPNVRIENAKEVGVHRLA